MAAVNWIASYPKSGNTWLRFMLASYLTKEPVTSARSKRLNALIPAIGGVASGRGVPQEDSGRPLIFKTHAIPSADAVRPYRAATSKAVYLVRNPRDVLLSLLRHSGAEPGTAQARDFATAFIANYGMPPLTPEFEWGNWPQSVAGWTDLAKLRQYFPNADVLPVRYEDMRADPKATLYKIVDFLDLGGPAAAEDVARAAESSSLERMRELEAQEGSTQEGSTQEGSTQEGSTQAGREAKPFRSRSQFVGQGLHNQSLTHLGADVEEQYQRLFAGDSEFSRCARQFGYSS